MIQWQLLKDLESADPGLLNESINNKKFLAERKTEDKVQSFPQSSLKLFPLDRPSKKHP